MRVREDRNEGADIVPTQLRVIVSRHPLASRPGGASVCGAVSGKAEQPKDIGIALAANGIMGRAVEHCRVRNRPPRPL